MKAKTLMIMGTMSSVGKSLLAAGLCRLFARKGILVYPFKAQNMSNNAAVCANGGEIGRAQAFQAAAAGVEAVTDMNPILMKPESNNRSQIIVNGFSIGSFSGKEYYAQHDMIWQKATQSLDRVRALADLVVIEGAGSMAELNLAKSDIVNLAVARYCKAPCLLVGDIDRGGIFAQLLGSWWLLEDTDKKYLKGFIVNKFRGDLDLFQNGIDILEERSQGKPVIGVVPFLRNHGIPDEDASSFSAICNDNPAARKICVVLLPHISNFDDFDPLKYESEVDLEFTADPQTLQTASAIILPGTKNTLEDLCWLKNTRLDKTILAAYERGVPVVGICGGYQIMGKYVDDPQHIESSVEKAEGLGILPVCTQLTGRKHTCCTQMRVISANSFLSPLNGDLLSGYEIHIGQTISTEPLFERIGEELSSTFDGAVSTKGNSFGTYLHGIFTNDHFRQYWLRTIGIQPAQTNWREKQAKSFDRLADHLEQHLNIPLIESIIDEGVE